MNTLARIALAFPLALACCSARAQDDASAAAAPPATGPIPEVPRPASPAGEVLTKAAESIRGLSSLTFDVSMRGEGLLAAYAPTLQAHVIAARSPTNPAVWLVRVVGVGTLQPDRPRVEFDASFQEHFIEWYEPAERKVLRRPHRPQPRSEVLRHAQQLRLDWLFGPLALSRELGVAVNGVVLEDAEVEGEPCHVVEVTIMGAAGGKRRVYVGVEDGIVRRYEMIVSGQFGGSTIFELSGVDGFTPVDPSETRVPVPPGVDAEPEPAPPSPAGAGSSAAGPPATPPISSAPPPLSPPPRFAPPFELSTATGEVVTGESLRGRVALLFFWGTWSLPSQDAVGPLAAIRARFAPERLAVLGLAVRERNPAAAAEYLQRENAGFPTLLRADEVASSFGVRVYPTFILLDPEGKILHTIEGFPLDATLDDLTRRIEAALKAEGGAA
jgi:thiol-disulfide isomerase/thioredoxin